MAKDDIKKGTTTRLTYRLKFPVSHGGELVEELDYRRAKGRDIKSAFKARSGGGDVYTSLLVNLFEQPEAFFDEIDASDYMALVDICDDFLSPPKPPKEASTV